MTATVMDNALMLKVIGGADGLPPFALKGLMKQMMTGNGMGTGGRGLIPPRCWTIIPTGAAGRMSCRIR